MNFNNYAEFTIMAYGGSEPNSRLFLEMIRNYIYDLVGGVGWPWTPLEQPVVVKHNVPMAIRFTDATEDTDLTSQDNLYLFYTDSKFTNYASEELFKKCLLKLAPNRTMRAMIITT